MSGNTLVAGSIGIDGKPTADSMALAIYDALEGLVKLGANEDPRGRSVLAVAIATGVIKHLKDNQGAFVPHGTTPSGNLTNGSITIS